MTLLFGATAALSKKKQETKEDEHVAPFRLKALDGTSFDSAQSLAGSVSIISFWRLEQDYSTRLLEDLVQIRKTFPAEELEIVTIISGDTDAEKAEALIEELGVSFPVLLDPNRDAYGAFGVIVSPSSWIVDKNGDRKFAYPGHRRDFSKVVETDVQFLLGRISNAQREARLVKKAAPRTNGTLGAAVRYRFAKRLLGNGKREAAKEQLREAWVAEPREVAAGIELGMFLLEDGKAQEALTILEKAVELRPEDPRARGGKGLALLRLGHEEEGESLLRWAVEHGVSEPILYYELARLSERRDAKDDALHYYRSGFELLIRTSLPKDETH